MIRVAQLLRGSRGRGPSAEFRARLAKRLMLRERGISRRAALLSGASSLAVGAAAGIGLDRAAGHEPAATRPAPLVGENGRWFQVATTADMPDGTIRPFAAGAVQGFLISQDGRLRALSRICTHMGCVLDMDHKEHTFVGPCHGAEFDLHGHLRYGPSGYDHSLPPLPGIKVRISGDAIQVWSI